jgi:CRP-like cAMP-binding protein
MDFETFYRLLEGIAPVSSSLKSYLRIGFKEHYLSDHQTLDSELKKAFPVIFVRKGLVKTHLESKIEPGKELLRFHFEGSMIPKLKETADEDYSLETFSINESTLLMLSESHVLNLYKLFPEFIALITKINEELVLDLFHKAFDLHNLNAEDRLRKLLSKQPDIFQMATVHDIAAAIGMRANTLSTLKNKKFLP